MTTVNAEISRRRWGRPGKNNALVLPARERRATQRSMRYTNPGGTMKVSDVITNWPAKRWAAADDDEREATLPPVELNELRLRWFSTPDSEGWFRMMATDWEQREWSTYCRVADLARWPVLEMTLSAKLHTSLEEVGALELRDTGVE